MAEYYAVSKGELAHSKGKWKKHKYVRKEGNRYIYPEDLVDSAKNVIGDAFGGKYKKQAKKYSDAANRNTKAMVRNASLARTYKQSHLPASRNIARGFQKSATKQGSNAIKYRQKAAEADRKYKSSLAYQAPRALKSFTKGLKQYTDNQRRYNELVERKKRENVARNRQAVKNEVNNINRQAKTVRKNVSDSYKSTKKSASDAVDKKKKAAQKKATEELLRANINRLYAEKEAREGAKRVRKNTKAYAKKKQKQAKKSIKRGRKQVAKYIYRKIAGE